MNVAPIAILLIYKMVQNCMIQKYMQMMQNWMSDDAKMQLFVPSLHIKLRAIA